ncbi:hypothetical protein F5Y16DRAFT_399223 [Xylariaceae sp. FL0255]|nr:hypothetical protein F5Y16DRAFT_399223 [Xylariaceae sp. FL0255]
MPQVPNPEMPCTQAIAKAVTKPLVALFRAHRLRTKVHIVTWTWDGRLVGECQVRVQCGGIASEPLRKAAKREFSRALERRAIPSDWEITLYVDDLVDMARARYRANARSKVDKEDKM